MSKSIILLIILLTLLLSSCGSDEGSDSVTGCTDPMALNFDSNAIENGTCMYSSDPYTGVYTFSVSNCNREPEIFGPVVFRIEMNDEDPNNIDLLMSGLTGAPVRFTGIISGNQVSFNSEFELFSSVLTQGLNYQDFLYAFVRLNLRGLLTRDEDILMGNLSLETTDIAELTFGDRIFQVSCDFTFNKS